MKSTCSLILLLLLFASSSTWAQIDYQISGGRVSISEVYYDSHLPEWIETTGHHRGEFIELFNSSCSDVNISGWKLSDANSLAYFTFPPGATIPAKGYVIFAYGSPSDNVKFHQIFPQAAPYTSQIYYQSGASTLILNNDGEILFLRDAAGVLKDVMGYGNRTYSGNTYPLYAANMINTTMPPSSRKSIQRKDKNSFFNQTAFDQQVQGSTWPVSVVDLNKPANFETNIATPFALSAPLNLVVNGMGVCHTNEPLYISQVYYDSYLESTATDFTGEFIELYNAGSTPIDMEYYTLKSARGNWTYDFRFQPGPIIMQPKTYLILVAGVGDFDLKNSLQNSLLTPTQNEAVGKVLTLHPALADKQKLNTNKVLFTQSLKMPNDKDAVLLVKNNAMVGYVGYGGYRYMETDEWALTAANQSVTQTSVNHGARNSIRRIFQSMSSQYNEMSLPGDYELGKAFMMSQNDYYSNQNYVSSEVLLTPITNEASVTSLTNSQKTGTFKYFDGLGRPIEIVERGASASGKDLVTYQSYDNMGRASTTYEPFATSTSDGGYRPMIQKDWIGFPVSEEGNFYRKTDQTTARTNKPYSVQVFDKSPLDVVRKIGFPGEDWQPTSNPEDLNDNSAKIVYSANTTADNIISLYVFEGSVSPQQVGDGSLRRNGMVPNGRLIKETIYSENHKTASNFKEINFRDDEGKLVLNRQNLNPGFADTYYVYDVRGNLCYTVQPEGSAILQSTSNVGADVIQKWSFVYRYDEKSRLVERKNPGVTSDYFVYDNRNRIVMTQTGAQRVNKQWEFTKYDKLNRPIIKGLYVHNSVVPEGTMKNSISTTVFSEDYNGNASTHGYTNLIFPQTNENGTALEIINVYYYDTYAYKSMMSVALDFAPGATPASNFVKGMPTGTKTRILETTNFLWNAVYFDEKYHVIQAVAQNTKGGINISTRTYYFNGQLWNEQIKHTVGGVITEANQGYSYDQGQRSRGSYHYINGQIDIDLYTNIYNEVGQLITKNIHFNSDTDDNYSQIVDYRYNTRGWLERINRSDLQGETTNAWDPKDMFGMNLYYNAGVSGLGNTAQYNGNVSAITYSVYGGASGIDQHAYKFSYDNRDQLTSANFFQRQVTWSATSAFFEGNMAYDKNGNITDLTRKGTTGNSIDILKYHYDGNLLMKVDDTGEKMNGFKDGTNTGNDYTYDAGGQLTSDKNKDIGDGAIIYNFMGLPVRVTKQSGENIRYTYDGNGIKLSKSLYDASNNLLKKEEYDAIFVYENNVLKLLKHSEGRAIKRGSTFVYEYDLKDHLGNTRVTFTTEPETDTFTAGYETDQAANESATFAPSYSNAVIVNSSLYSAGGTRSQRLSAANQNEIIGLSKSMRVLPGDVIDLSVKAKYTAPTTNNTNVAGLILGSIASAFGVSSVSTGEGALLYQSLQDLNSLGVLINGEGVNENVPKAYINYILFDNNYVAYDAGFKQVTTAGLQTSTVITPETLALQAEVTKPGYIYVYLSNENQKIVDVYFDNLSIIHRHSKLLQVNEYYPFGMTFNTLMREENLVNKFLVSGKELQDELGLNFYDFGPRNYMPDLGRWSAPDPLAHMGRRWSPYAYNFNNPLRYIDPTGLLPTKAELDGNGMEGPRLEYFDLLGESYAGSGYNRNNDDETDPNKDDYDLVEGYELQEVVVKDTKLEYEDDDDRGFDYDKYDVLGFGMAVSDLFREGYKTVRHGFLAEWKYGLLTKYVKSTNPSRLPFINSMKGFKAVGKFMMRAGLAVAVTQFALSNHTGEDFAKLAGAVAITAVAFIPIVGPVASIGLAALDSFGVFDKFYASFN